MKNYLNEINQAFPIRRKTNEKEKFIEYVKNAFGSDRVNVETLEKSHNNIIIGDITRSRVVFTAHYDTPAASLVPNMMFPANKVSGMLVNLLYPIALALISLLVGFLLAGALGLGDTEAILIYFVLFYCSYFLSTRLISNKNNANDNTSGVATVMTIAGSAESEKIAFILFDNEEKGLLGSKAFNKKYSDILKDKLVVNFDCVGNGDQLIFVYKENVPNLPEYNLLCKSLIPSGTFDIHHLPFKKCIGNSDYKNFLNGVGVMACKSGKFFRFYTDRIHTSKDTVASEENVTFLADRMVNLIEKL